MYGANAFTAAINVIMKKPGDLRGAELHFEGGNAGRLHENAAVGYKGDAAGVLLAFDHLDTNGTREPVTGDAFGNSGVTNFWRDNYTAHAIAEWEKFSLTGLLVKKKRGTPLTITNLVDRQTHLDFRQAFGELKYVDRFAGADTEFKLDVDFLNFNPNWQFGGIPVGSPADPVNFANPRGKNLTLSPRLKLNFEPLSNHFVTLGIDYDYMRQYDVRHILNGVDVSASFNHNRNVSRNVIAAYVQDEWEIRRDAILTLGVRMDHYSDFGYTVNPRAALVWGLTDDVDLKLLYGRAFRAPSFIELFEINNPAAVGNPNLQPEIMNTYEAGLAWRLTPAWKLSADAFYNRFSRRIVRQLPLSTNAGGARVWGLEAELRADIRESLYGYVSYSFQNSKDSRTQAALADVPRHRVKLGGNMGLLDERLNVNAALRWTGERPRTPGDARAATPSNTVIDAALHTGHWLGSFNLAFKVHNLLDADVFDPSPATVANGFPRPGRTWLLEGSYAY